MSSAKTKTAGNRYFREERRMEKSTGLISFNGREEHLPVCACDSMCVRVILYYSSSLQPLKSEHDKEKKNDCQLSDSANDPLNTHLQHTFN